MKAITFIASAIIFTNFAIAGSVTKEDKEKAAETIKAFSKLDQTFSKFLAESHAYVVYPKVGKGGVIIGAAHGNGLVYEKNGHGYGLVGTSELTQVSFGLQIICLALSAKRAPF